ncbi:hypothetical protein ACFQT0_00830 [Hymenobacter humi]|uniref:Type I restriction enzyme R protein N-terminal domain-containing protein n=1 Tax=Hymenobacter humi TaxID=1411620 RepID=A0ABW2TZU6_9BACT
MQGVRSNAENHTSIFQKNEAATRAALIDPVLRALGWDTSNVQMVEPEKSLGNELRVDYLLKDPAGKPYLVIEAKCLGSTLDKYGYVGKILGYALTLNVQTVCITDGISRHIHSNLQQGKSEPIAFTFTENTLLAAANQLVQWLDAAQCGHGLTSAVLRPVAFPKHEALPSAIPNGKPTQVVKQQIKLKKLPPDSSKFIEPGPSGFSVFAAGPETQGATVAKWRGEANQNVEGYFTGGMPFSAGNQ